MPHTVDSIEQRILVLTHHAVEHNEGEPGIEILDEIARLEDTRRELIDKLIYEGKEV
jgi:hypothetical protein